MKTQPASKDTTWCDITRRFVQTHVVECTSFKRRGEQLKDLALLSQAVTLDIDWQGKPHWTRNGKPYVPRKRRVTRRRVIANPRVAPVVN